MQNSSWIYPWMWVTKGGSWGAGPSWHTCAIIPRGRWLPTWPRTTKGKWKQYWAVTVHAKRGSVGSSEVTLNTVLENEQGSYILDGWHMWSYSPAGIQHCTGGKGVWSIWWQCVLGSQQEENYGMAENSATPREWHKGGCHISRCVGETGPEEKGKTVEEVQSRDSGETTLAKSCYNTKNTATDCCILARLERELQALFWFEDGNGKPVNFLWVVRILLGRLLHERTTLDRAIKKFAKFQRREIMRGMVKLNDQEDLDEPPLAGDPKASPSAPRQSEGMDLEPIAGRGMGTPNNVQFKQDDDLNGLD